MSRWEGIMRRARGRRGLTQRQVGKMIGITQSGVAIAECKSYPTLQQLERYAAVLGYRLEVRMVDELEEGREDIT